MDRKAILSISPLMDDGAYGEERLFRYTFDPSLPLLSTEQLSVSSLRDSGTVRRAIREFQRQRPDLDIQYIAGWNDGIVKADAAEAMERRIAQGQGPDVVLLDGLDAASLIDQGLFLPLSPPEGCFDNILSSFRRGDELMALPARFDASVPCAATVGGEPWEGTVNGFARYQHTDDPATVPAQNEFKPFVIAAVSASCKNPETARAFVDTLYLETVQRGDFQEGFPVLKTAFLDCLPGKVAKEIQRAEERLLDPETTVTADREILDRCAALTKMTPVTGDPPETP